LLQNQNAAKLVYAAHLTSLASNAAEEYEVQLTPLILRSQYDVPNDTSPPFSREGIDPKKETLRKYIMFHSSGSTGLPKPIHHQNARLLATILTAQPYKSFSSLPLFHAHGFITLVQAIWSRKVLHLFNGHMPQTQETVTQAIKAAKPEYVLMVPYVLKLLAKKRDGIEVLRAVRTVSITGSKCPDELGDMLTREGVWVGSAFGS
jgi:acyl-coenzyme A synthetase/AMP-(fatty) acid ligase